MVRLFLCGMIFFLFSGGCRAAEPPAVLIIGLDGFRHDYVDQYDFKFLKNFRGRSAIYGRFIPQYPSLTFPNFFSMATGRAVVDHGLLSNYFYSPRRDRHFTIRDRASYLDANWYHGQPIWMAIEGGKRSAVFFWPGSEINMLTPAIFKQYDGTIPNQQRLDEVLTWLRQDPAQRPHFMMAYFSTPDYLAQKHGIGSPEFIQGVQELDTQLENFVKIAQKERPDLNIIIVSDHGMVDSDPAEQVFLDDLANLDTYIESNKIFPLGPLVTIYEPDAAKAAQLKEELAAKAKFYQVYLKKELPAAFNYQHEDVGDIVVVAECGKYVTIHKYPQTDKAAHGYAPWLCPHHEMDGIIYAQGPNFVRGNHDIGELDNRQLYPIVMAIYQQRSIDTFAAPLGQKLYYYLNLDKDGQMLEDAAAVDDTPKDAPHP
ncbi:MAG: alkaline phosphatase family protein [Bacteriovoracaceae bacterium]|nr:alkaline phosphatase family protein [Bacteriovoracaceae bacterium]